MAINQVGPSSPISAIAEISTPKQAPQPVATLKPDIVKLTLSAQIKLMRHQGASPAVIAAQLGMNAKQLAAYSPATPASQAASTPVVAASTTHEVDADGGAGNAHGGAAPQVAGTPAGSSSPGMPGGGPSQLAAVTSVASAKQPAVPAGGPQAD